MDGLIPFLLHALKKQKPQNITRCLSDNSTTSRSYHLLIGGGGDSTEGSSHRRTRSEFQPTSSAVDEHLARLRSFSPRTPAAAPPSSVDDGPRQRGHASAAAQYEVSGRVNNYRR